MNFNFDKRRSIVCWREEILTTLRRIFPEHHKKQFALTFVGLSFRLKNNWANVCLQLSFLKVVSIEMLQKTKTRFRFWGNLRFSVRRMNSLVTWSYFIMQFPPLFYWTTVYFYERYCYNFTWKWINEMRVSKAMLGIKFVYNFFV